MLPSPRRVHLFERCLAELRRSGVLLKSDPRLPSVTNFAAGEPIRGSWWGHPKGRSIFAALERLADHPEAALTKLISGKDTFVHRSLWPLLAAAVSSTEAGVSQGAARLLARVTRDGLLRADGLRGPGARAAIRELESRLLIRTTEFHTETGAHAKRLQSWEHWARRSRQRRSRLSASQARELLQRLVDRLNAAYGAKATLPASWALSAQGPAKGK